jgi:homoserine trans-succinylase
MSKVEDHEGKQVYVINKKEYVELTWARDMQRAIERVRKLHEPYKYDLLIDAQACSECSQINKHGMSVFGVPYPCPTIQALDGEQ